MTNSWFWKVHKKKWKKCIMQQAILHIFLCVSVAGLLHHFGVSLGTELGLTHKQQGLER